LDDDELEGKQEWVRDVLTDQGGTWSPPRLTLLGLEGVLGVLPGGAVIYPMREQNYHTLWISYDGGHTWESQHEPYALPWRTKASVVHTQWPPGGTPRFQVLDDRTAVVAAHTGLAPYGAFVEPSPPDSEFQGWIYVRFLRRQSG